MRAVTTAASEVCKENDKICMQNVCKWKQIKNYGNSQVFMKYFVFAVSTFWKRWSFGHVFVMAIVTLCMFIKVQGLI